MWKLLYHSVEGTSHARDGIPCQDFSLAASLQLDGQTFLIAVCADGAGSAKESQIGSKIACEAAFEAARTYLQGGRKLDDCTDETGRDWHRAAHSALQNESASRGCSVRDLACTLLLAIVGETCAVFAQIGDGGIVTRAAEEFVPVFWPEAGEYLNTTFFVTDAEFEKHIQLKVVPGRLHNLAMFTDGLQLLALNFASHVAHQPFFGPMFAQLRDTAETTDLIVPMRQFLESSHVNSRTDDDKTLILALRIEPDGSA